jgi:DNA-binding NarL/FixJ family response regulator
MKGRHEKWDDELLARAVGLKRAGFSNKQIGEKLGKPEGSVKNRLARVGAKHRLTGTGGRGARPLGRITLATMEATSETNEMLGISSTTEE